jgi:hypothetical protein
MRAAQSTDQKVGGSSPSERAQVKGPSRCGRGLLLTAELAGVRDRAGEDVGGLGELVADHVGVYAQGDGWVGMAEPGGDDMDRDTFLSGEPPTHRGLLTFFSGSLTRMTYDQLFSALHHAAPEFGRVPALPLRAAGLVAARFIHNDRLTGALWPRPSPP